MNNESVAALEQLFGDPWDSANPCSFSEILAADECAEMLVAGEQILDHFGFAAEFVPVALGGRLHSLTGMIELGRAVFRHDPCLGLGYGASALVAAVNVWSAGTLAQQEKVAALLLHNRKLSCGYHELEHGNDLARVEFEALLQDDHWVLNGGKQVIANIERADAIVIYARTEHHQGSRSHSQLLLEKSTLPPSHISYPPRFASIGMRGVQLGGIAVHDCPIAPDSIIGIPGHGLETALKVFQVTRVALPGMFMGILDTGLRSTLRYARQRMLYGRAVLDLPQTQTVMVNAFADLLLCDCFTTVVARSLHLTPNAGSIYSAAVKYLIPKLLIDAMTGLSAILGSQFYLRNGDHALFQKLLRDLKPASFGHAARTTCQMTILPQLPQLARRAWLQQTTTPAPAAMFQFEQDLPPFSFQALTIGADGQDPLAAALVETCAALHEENKHPQLAVLAQGFVDELVQLQQLCAVLPPTELSVMASPCSYALTTRYVMVLAASACLNLWWHNRAQGDLFLRDPIWLELVLQRLQSMLTKTPHALSEQHSAHLLAELLERYQHAVSFDLTRRALPGWAASLSSTSC